VLLTESEERYFGRRAAASSAKESSASASIVAAACARSAHEATDSALRSAGAAAARRDYFAALQSKLTAKAKVAALVASTAACIAANAVDKFSHEAMEATAEAAIHAAASAIAQSAAGARAAVVAAEAHIGAMLAKVDALEASKAAVAMARIASAEASLAVSAARTNAETAQRWGGFWDKRKALNDMTNAGVQKSTSSAKNWGWGWDWKRWSASKEEQPQPEELIRVITSKDGRNYYYNAQTGKSGWTEASVLDHDSSGKFAASTAAEPSGADSVLLVSPISISPATSIGAADHASTAAAHPSVVGETSLQISVDAVLKTELEQSPTAAKAILGKLTALPAGHWLSSTHADASDGSRVVKSVVAEDPQIDAMNAGGLAMDVVVDKGGTCIDTDVPAGVEQADTEPVSFDANKSRTNPVGRALDLNDMNAPCSADTGQEDVGIRQMRMEETIISSMCGDEVPTARTMPTPLAVRPTASRHANPIDWDSLMDGYTTGYATVASDNDADTESASENCRERRTKARGRENEFDVANVQRRRRKRVGVRRAGAARREDACVGGASEHTNAGGGSPKLQVLLLQLDAAEAASRAKAIASGHPESRFANSSQINRTPSQQLAAPSPEVSGKRRMQRMRKQNVGSAKKEGHCFDAGSMTNSGTPESRTTTDFRPYNGSNYSLGSGNRRVRQRPKAMAVAIDKKNGPSALRRSLMLRVDNAIDIGV
jgi:hypothetical protein